MSSIAYYANLLRLNQITPAAIEAKIRDLNVELQDEEYFLQEGIRTGELQVKKIESLRSQLNEFRRVLAGDYVEAVARGLESPAAPVPAPAIPPTKTKETITELWDGTRLTEEEAATTKELLDLANKGKITKQTLLETVWALEDQLEKFSRDDSQREPLAVKIRIIHHVIRTGKFTARRFRYYR